MIFFYRTLISIKVCVQNANGTNAGDSLRTSFRILPTQGCRKTLRQYGLIFKSSNGGGLILQELVGDNINNATAKRKITTLIAFQFTMHLNSKKLLSRIRPYVNNPGTGVKPTSLSAFLGRVRVLYFDNLNGTNQIITSPIQSECQQQIRHLANGDPDIGVSGNFQYDPIAVVPLTTLASTAENRVGLNDLASTLPNRFTYVSEISITREVYAIHPVNTSVIAPNPPDDTSELPYYDLSDGAYRLVERINGNSTEEVVYGSNELVNTNGMGIIHIYKDDANISVYEIKFELA